MSGQVRLDRDGEIAIITIDNPPVNATSQAVRAGILEALGGIGDARAVVLTAAGRTFVAGADIKEFANAPLEPHLPEVVLALAGCDVPVIAVLHGTTLGGGLELALGCHMRVAMPGTKLGLPEVSLGIIPGAGGTQLLPPLAGLERALEMITGAERVGAAQALEDGIVDAISDESDPRSAGLAAARQVLETGLPDRGAGKLDGRHPDDPVFGKMAAQLEKSARGQIAPQKAIEAVRRSLDLPLAEGMAAERALFQDCRKGPQRGALVHLFFAERAATKLKDGPEPRSFDTVGVIGAGTMGAGIAMACAAAGYETVIVDRDQAALDRALTRISGSHDRAVQRGKMDAAQAEAIAGRLRIATSYDALSGAGLVVEAVFESMEVKHAVFRELDRVLPEGAILATNTSSLDIDEIGSVTARGADVVGLHFFSPAHVMKLVEVVRAKGTSEEALSTAMAFSRRIRKVPVPVGMVPGFVGNRMLFHYGREAESLLEEGATPAQVDRVLRDYGMAMGVFAVRDLSGNDVGLAVRKEWRAHYPHHPFPEVIDAVVAEGRTGQKAGKGYFDYREGDRTPHDSAEVAAIIEAVAARRGITRRKIDDDEIRDRCVLALVNEGARLIGSGAARSAGDVDVVYRYGYGFPAWRGGPMYDADQRGLAEVLARTREFHDRLGPWWEPAPLLVDLAEAGRSFTG